MILIHLVWGPVSWFSVHMQRLPADSNVQTKNPPGVHGESLFHTHKMDDAIGFNN